MTDSRIGQVVRAALVQVASARGTVLDATPGDANIFFDLGFDSIQVLEITAELEARLGVELPMQRWLDEQSCLGAHGFTVDSLVALCGAAVSATEKRRAHETSEMDDESTRTEAPNRIG